MRCFSWIAGAFVVSCWGCGSAVEPEDASDYDEHRASYEVVTEQPTLVVVQCPPGSVCTHPQPAPAAVVITPAPAVIAAPIAVPPAPARAHPLVQSEVLDHYPKFRKCYEKGLRHNPGLGGRVTVRMNVDDDGEVDEAFDYGSSLPDRKVVRCVVKVFKGLDFRDSVGRIVVHSLDFSPTAIRG